MCSSDLYKPKMIAVFTSCMPEVIGDDLTAFLKNARAKGHLPKDLPTPYANTPSFKGTHVTGYDNMLAAIQLKRGENVYIANVLKCRPPRNRNPEPHEIERCEPYLLRQVELVRPRLILALGRFAMQSILRSAEPIGRLRGKVHQYHGVPVVVTYHPGYLLRSPVDKSRVWEDLCLAREVMDGLGD